MEKLNETQNEPNCINFLLGAVSESNLNSIKEVREYSRDEKYDFEITFNLSNGRQTSPHELS